MRHLLIAVSACVAVLAACQGTSEPVPTYSAPPVAWGAPIAIASASKDAGLGVAKWALYADESDRMHVRQDGVTAEGKVVVSYEAREFASEDAKTVSEIQSVLPQRGSIRTEEDGTVLSNTFENWPAMEAIVQLASDDIASAQAEEAQWSVFCMGPCGMMKAACVLPTLWMKAACVTAKAKIAWNYPRCCNECNFKGCTIVSQWPRPR